MVFLTNADLKDFNTFKLPSRCREFVSLSNGSDLPSIAEKIKSNSSRHYVLGGGSNIILPSFIDALVIQNNLLGKTRLSLSAPNELTVGAGENWSDFVDWTLKQNLFGLENLSLIPGTVGASPIQNIGAYGVEVKDRIKSVRVYDLKSKTFFDLSNAECIFSYRDSIFKKQQAKNWIIVSVTFVLDSLYNPILTYKDLANCFVDHIPSAVDVSKKIIEIRQNKLPDPKLIPNVGSFFKNPIIDEETKQRLNQKFSDLVMYPWNGQYKLAAGQLIEKCGFKGKNVSNVSMYEKQALVMINLGQATYRDVLFLKDKIIEAVKTEFFVELEPEPLFW